MANRIWNIDGSETVASEGAVIKWEDHIFFTLSYNGQSFKGEILEEKTEIKIEKIRLKELETQKKREEKEKEKEEKRKLKYIESQKRRDEEQIIREAAAKLKYESEKLKETEERLRNFEIERQQDLARQLLKEETEQKAKEEEIKNR